MSGFVAPATSADTVITNDGWWPNVDPSICRDILRIDGTVTPARLRDALISAIGSVNAELAPWRASQEAAGAADLASIAAPIIDGTSRYVHLYLHAVQCTALAWLIERHRSLDITDSGQRKVEEQTPSIDELRRDARWAIRDILGVSHTTVELI